MIPIYRAKRNDSNKYIEGLLSKSIIGGNEAYFIESWEKHRIDISTLSIHFPDMLDNQGNKIFASLQENGKGGDILEVFNIDQKEYQDGYCLYSTWEKGIRFSNGSYEVDYDIFGSLKIIGIKE